jgi:septum site-determining protein MinD
MVVSGKGGTGKTTMTANLGAVIAEKGKKVLLIDLDMGMRNLDLAMGMESRVIYDILDILSGTCKVKQGILRDRYIGNLYMMPASQHPEMEKLTEESLRQLCDKVCSKFDVVFLDCPSGMGPVVEMAASVADQALIVTTPEYAALRDGDSMDRLLARLGVNQRHCLINRIDPRLMKKGLVPSLEQIGQLLRTPIAGTVLLDDEIYVGTNNGKVAAVEKGTYINRNFNKIADRILPADHQQ